MNMAKTKMLIKTLSWETGQWSSPIPGGAPGETIRQSGGNGGKVHIEQSDGTVQEYLFPAGFDVTYSPDGGWIEIPDEGVLQT